MGIRLIGFSDASMKAYAAIIYICLETSEEQHIRFIVSKTRVAPISGQTMPQLELLAALLLAKLMVSVRTALKPEKPIRVHTCYTDSRAVLHWITSSTKEWRQFIQNRVNQIRSLLPVEVWKHCHGAGNPADIASIGVSFFQDC